MRPPARPIRVPLAVGLAALRSQLRVVFLAWPGLVVLFATLPVARFLYRVVDVPVLGSIVALVGLVVVGLAALFMWGWALSSSEEARREEPSDCILDGEGLCVEGGPRRGLRVGWSEVAGCTVEPAARQDKLGLRHTLLWILTLGRWDAARFRREVHELRLARRSEEPLVLAVSDDPEEIESLRALAESIGAIAAEEAPGSADPPDPPPEGAPALFLCQDCGAPLAPVDDAAAACGACAASTPVPDELRERVRAPEEVARGLRAEPLVARVLAQPRLASSRAWLALVRWAGRLIWPLGLGAFLGLALFQESRSRNYPVVLITSGYAPPYRHDVLLGIVVLVGIVAALAATALAFLATRRSLGLLALRFGAAAPARAGAAPACRACGAPLPERPGRLVVGCVYCAAENVLESDLVPVRRARGQVRSVEAALIHRRRARQRLAITAATALIALFLLGRELRLVAAWAPPRAPFSPCVICTRASFRNVEDDRQLVTLTMGRLRRRFLVPARAHFDVECLDDCTIELGRERLTIGDTPDPFDERPGPFELRDGHIHVGTGSYLETTY